MSFPIWNKDSMTDESSSASMSVIFFGKSRLRTRKGEPFTPGDDFTLSGSLDYSSGDDFTLPGSLDYSPGDDFTLPASLDYSPGHPFTLPASLNQA
jgi:hypothetical protein